jgi:serine phosphatase RsbU (regulator of sigma subunit)
MKNRTTILVFWMIMQSFLLPAQERTYAPFRISLTSREEKYHINEFVFHLRDETAKLSFEDITLPEFSERFIKSASNRLNFGFDQSAFWFMFQVQNLEPEINDWQLEIEDEHIDSIEFYFMNPENKWEKKRYGEMYPFSQREWDSRTFIIPLELNDSIIKKYYIRLRTQGTLHFDLNIYREKECLRKVIRTDTYYGIFFGIIFLLIIYNIFIFFSLRDLSYFYYILLILSSLVFLSLESGHMFQYILPDSMRLNIRLLPPSIPFCEFFFLLFTISFLNVKKYSLLVYKSLISFMVLAVILVFLLFIINYHHGIQIAAYSSQIYIFLTLISGIVCYVRGNRGARMFVLGFTMYFIGALAISFLAIGIVRDNFVTMHGMELGSMFNGLLLSLALIDNYRISKMEKEKAQEEIIQIREKAAEILEKKVIERTLQIELQKQEITDSIHYASRIQNALLPPEEDIKNLLPSYFILNKPRDIVSGDYYWVAGKDNKVITTVADCTGHGVPGAFMSILGIALLNEIVSKTETLIASEILNQMSEKLIKSLRQSLEDDKTRNGIEMALCIIDFEMKKLQYAGAFRPLYLIRNKVLSEIKGDFMPIGIYEGEKNPFRNKEIHLQSDDIIYMCSDGYADQIGGPNRKTFRSRQFKELLTAIHQKPLNEQKIILETNYNDWKGDVEQIDDILVMGIKFS